MNPGPQRKVKGGGKKRGELRVGVGRKRDWAGVEWGKGVEKKSAN